MRRFCRVQRLAGCRLLTPLFALTILAFALPGTASAAFPGANGRIAFESNNLPGPDLEINTSYADGSTVQALTNNGVDDQEPAWSPDGRKIAYERKVLGAGNFWEIWTMNADGSNQQALVTSASIGGVDARNPTWSRDGSRIAFTIDVGSNLLYRADTSAPNTNVQPVVAAGNNLDPAYAPNSNKIAFSRSTGGPFELYTVNDDGTGLTPLAATLGINLTRPSWSPDGTKLAYEHHTGASYDLYTINANGTGTAPVLTSGVDERYPAWSPEIPSPGSMNMITYTRLSPAGTLNDVEIYTVNQDGTGNMLAAARPSFVDRRSDWQPVRAAQVRPLAATPMYLTLVPAFNECTSPTTTHEPPLSLASCVPARASNSDLTVGEPQVNGKSPNSVGSVRISAIPGDLQFAINVTDVRCARTIVGACSGGPLSDFTGIMNLKYGIRLTDRSNPVGTAGTVVDTNVDIAWFCGGTADPAIGSNCSVTVGLNTIVPGLVVAGRRAIWRLRSLALQYPPGNDFAVPGSFIP
jgi:TolB protein